MVKKAVSNASPRSKKTLKSYRKWTFMRWSTSTEYCRLARGLIRTTGSATLRRSRFSWRCALTVIWRGTFRRREMQRRIRRIRVKRLISTRSRSRSHRTWRRSRSWRRLRMIRTWWRSTRSTSRWVLWRRVRFLGCYCSGMAKRRVTFCTNSKRRNRSFLVLNEEWWVEFSELYFCNLCVFKKFGIFRILYFL